MRTGSGCMEKVQELKTENVSFTKSQAKGKNVCSYEQMEIPKSPYQAMEFLSRPWSPSSSDFLQISSTNNLLLRSNTNEEADEGVARTHISSLNQDNVEIDFIQPKTWLRARTLTSLLRSRKEKKKEEKRLQTAQLHAALSLTQLAAAIAGISRSQESSPASWQGMGGVISSAASLVSNVCAEAAESLGAKRAQTRAAFESGMAVQNPIDMIEVTATAATCLRGAALLKSRASTLPISRIQETLKISAEILTIMPSGRKECTRVSFHLKSDHVMFCFRKKFLHGAFTTAREYQITNITEERMEHQSNSLLCLKTKNGIIKLLFEDQMQSKIWISTILNLLEISKPAIHDH